MKHKLLYVVCTVVVLAIGAILFVIKDEPTLKKVTISADYPNYGNSRDLIDKADTIIKGRIISYKYSEINIAQKPQSGDEYLNPGGEMDNSVMPYTIFTVDIEETFKGNIDNKKTIDIKEPGGIIGNTEYINEDSAKLKKESTYVFFLETYSDSPASLLNPVQARYEFNDNGSIILDKQNNIKLNINDLNNIK